MSLDGPPGCWTTTVKLSKWLAGRAGARQCARDAAESVSLPPVSRPGVSRPRVLRRAW